MTNEEIDALIEERTKMAIERSMNDEDAVAHMIYTRGCMLLLAEIAKRLPPKAEHKLCLACDEGFQGCVCTCTDP